MDNPKKYEQVEKAICVIQSIADVLVECLACPCIQHWQAIKDPTRQAFKSFQEGVYHMLSFTFSFLPKPGNIDSLVSSAEEVADSWDGDCSDMEAHMIANHVAKTVCISSLGYTQADEKVYQSVIYMTLKRK